MREYRQAGGSAGLRVILSIVVIVAIVACSDAVEPEGGDGGYDLALVDGQPVPAVYLVYGFGARKRLVSGSLDLNSATRLTDIRHTTNTPFGADPIVEDFHDTTAYAYRLVGDMLIIDRSNPAAPAAAYSDTGFVDGDVLYLPVATVDGTPNQRRLLTYVKRR